jgi:tetratricopeptide (TPR) repeat protein
MILASLGLLDQVLREYPESSELATVYFQQGDCLTMLGRDGEAIESLRRSIEMQRRRPSVRNSAHLAFGELVVRLRLRELYAEVLRDLDDLGDLDDLPIEQYRQQVIRASILDESGRLDEARQAAAQALKASEQTQSPYRNHPKIGLVGSPDRRVQEWLAAIVSRGGRA